MGFRIIGEGDDDWESLKIQFSEPVHIIRNNKEHREALDKSENSRLKELEEKYHK